MELVTLQISEKIADLRTQGPHPFINTSQIPSLFSDNQIPQILAECGADPYQITNYGSIVQSKAPKLLAILIWVQQPHLIITLVEFQIFDTRLPLSREVLQRIPGISLLNPQFFETQYEFIPHFFQHGLHSHIDDHRTVLPFRVVQPLPDLDGAFGSISRVTIHPAFHNLVPRFASQHSFIQKEVRLTNGPTSFQHERKNLELLYCLKHPNIVELLCSYTTTTRITLRDSAGVESTVVDHKHYFLFPEEAMDLDKFLHNPQPYGLFDRKEMYYLALQGLASALLGVHNIKINKASHLVDLERIGSHRDIRLPNILVRPDTFLLADFGLTDFKNVNNERGSKTLFKAGRGDYIAPECYENTLKRQEVGRSMDIWAFGCILVEVATYMETGSDGLRQFQETRIGPWLPNFDNGYFFHERALKPIIVDHMSNLQGSASDHAYPKLLDLAQLMLQMEPKERLTAQEAWRGLSCICTLKLHGQVESALTSYDNFLSTGGGVGPSRIIQWFETERFRSWADTLGLHQDVKSHCTRLEDIIDFHASQTRLIELRDIVREHHKRVEYELHGDEDGLQLVLLHSQFEESLSKCMREIFSCLPPRLQKRADVWWTQRLLQDSTQQKLMELVDRSQSTGNEPYKELRRRALVKKNLIGLSENSAPSPELSQLRLNPDNVSGTRTCGFHDYGYYRNGSELIRVLIEPTFIATDEANRATIPTDELAIRKIALARLFATPGKPPDFHTLDCIGFVDVEQPGASVAKFVYKLPKGCQPDFAHHKPHNDPQSLLQILNKKSPGGPQVPPLEQRLQLAQTLVASLHSLHLNGWLHKSLNSDNVLIFESPAGVYDLAEPRIVGFKDSRPDGDIWTSAGPQVNPSLNDYAHPTYRRPHAGVGEQIRFRKAYDYYSLGTMLLEIGVWRSLESLLRKASNDPEARRVVLLQQLPVLRQFMGSTYASAVEKCLDTNFVEEKPGTGAEEQVNEFYLDVVEHITEIHV